MVLSVVNQVGHLSPREKTPELSRLARVALKRSADISGVVLGNLDKGERGRPVPSNGIHWSIAHTKEHVAAVTAPFPVGIDVEHIAPFKEDVLTRVAEQSEWDLAGAIDKAIFCRYWTAKEAVLKAVGIGLGGLHRCFVTAIIDECHLELQYDEEIWLVSSVNIPPDHLGAISVPADGVEWHIGAF